VQHAFALGTGQAVVVGVLQRLPGGRKAFELLSISPANGGTGDAAIFLPSLALIVALPNPVGDRAKTRDEPRGDTRGALPRLAVAPSTE